MMNSKKIEDYEEMLKICGDFMNHQNEYIKKLESELTASRDSRTLSAVPSEELTKLYAQFDTTWNMFTDNNIGIYKFKQAMISLGDAISHFKYFEKQRGIAR